jgi:hypothetical protein
MNNFWKRFLIKSDILLCSVPHENIPEGFKFVRTLQEIFPSHYNPCQDENNE